MDLTTKTTLSREECITKYCRKDEDVIPVNREESLLRDAKPKMTIKRKQARKVVPNK